MADQRIRRRLLPHFGFFLRRQLASGIFTFHLAPKITKPRRGYLLRTRAQDLGAGDRDDVESVRSFGQVKITGNE